MRGALAGALVVVVSIAVLWLALHRIPSWYVPVYVAHDQLDAVRADTARTYNRFGNRLVRRKTFDLKFNEDQVTAWINAREHIWPESGGWLPAWIEDPVVRFRAGSMVVAARIHADHVQFVGSAALTVEIGADDILVIRLQRASAGALPIPVGLLAEPLAQLLRLEGRDLDFMPLPVADAARYFRESEPVQALTEGVRRANRFIWENGRRPYRIADLKIDEGSLTLTIEPL
ncbi:MAG: hypothetical protein GY842_16795 [bacterium]|nr:hypothetical protein [bacterium]